MVARIAYLGPAGTFTEEAGLLYNPAAHFVPFATVPAVANAVETGMCDEGIVPIENSLEGPVIPTVDLLIHEAKLHIRAEIQLPIVQCLFVRPGMTTEDIQVIHSHPQALGQCRRFIELCFPKARTEASLSTVQAVQDILSLEGAAAIAPRRAGALYPVELLAEDIADVPNNVTRFAVLGQTDHEPTGRDKTSLCFAFTEDKPGSLVEVLQEWSGRGINLAKIESRPSKESLGKYIFLVDLEGHRLDPDVAASLEVVRAKSDPTRFKVFGSYPRFNGNGG